MPKYKSYLRSLPSFDPKLNRRFGKLFAIEIAPWYDQAADVSEYAYFLPYWSTTHLGLDVAQEYGFDGTADLEFFVRTKDDATGRLMQARIIVPKDQVSVAPWLPIDFMKIGSEAIIANFLIDPNELAPPYTHSLPAILNLVLKPGLRSGGCFPRPVGPTGMAATASP